MLRKKPGLPVFMQLAELLTREIAAGHHAPGERLPPEILLAERLGVAVGTLRKALGEMRKRGLIESRQGSGNYVRQAGAHKGIYEFFRLELIGGGGLPTAEILSIEKIAVPPEILKHVRWKSRRGFRIRRKRYLSGLAFAVEEIWIDGRHAKSLKKEEISDSLYLHYQNHFGFWIAKVEDQIGLDGSPEWSDPETGLISGMSAPHVQRFSWANNGAVEEFSRTWFNAQRARYAARWH